jgi:hypothetical protein
MSVVDRPAFGAALTSEVQIHTAAESRHALARTLRPLDDRPEVSQILCAGDAVEEEGRREGVRMGAQT